MPQQPLVSVVLSSYNHARYIEEALESIAQQSYDNKELIIADDGSTDETVYIAEEWLKKNAAAFKKTILLASPENTGITFNMNRGFTAAKGELIKVLAADDMLREGCLAEMASKMEETQADIAFCYEYVFYPPEQKWLGTDKENSLEKRPSNIAIFSHTAENLYKSILRANSFPAPTSMIRKKCYEELGGFDNRYRFMEDYPFWLKALRNNAKVVFVDIIGVNYRKTEKSISWRAKEEPTPSQIQFQECLDRFIQEVRDPELRRLGMKVLQPSAPPDNAISLKTAQVQLPFRRRLIKKVKKVLGGPVRFIKKFSAETRER